MIETFYLSHIPGAYYGAGLFAVVALWFIARPDTPARKHRERGLAEGGLCTFAIMAALFYACRLMFA